MGDRRSWSSHRNSRFSQTFRRTRYYEKYWLLRRKRGYRPVFRDIPERRQLLMTLRRMPVQIRHIRQTRGLSVFEAARRCGKPFGWIRLLEEFCVNISFAKLELLARALETTESDLLRRPSVRRFAKLKVDERMLGEGWPSKRRWPPNRFMKPTY